MRFIAGLVTLVVVTFNAGGEDVSHSSRIDPGGRIQSEIAAGSKTLSIPCGSYRLVPRDGSTCYLELRGLSGVTLDFCGSELVNVSEFLKSPVEKPLKKVNAS